MENSKIVLLNNRQEANLVKSGNASLTHMKRPVRFGTFTKLYSVTSNCGCIDTATWQRQEFVHSVSGFKRRTRIEIKMILATTKKELVWFSPVGWYLKKEREKVNQFFRFRTGQSKLKSVLHQILLLLHRCSFLRLAAVQWSLALVGCSGWSADLRLCCTHTRPVLGFVVCHRRLHSSLSEPQAEGGIVMIRPLTAQSSRSERWMSPRLTFPSDVYLLAEDA